MPARPAGENNVTTRLMDSTASAGGEVNTLAKGSIAQFDVCIAVESPLAVETAPKRKDGQVKHFASRGGWLRTRALLFGGRECQKSHWNNHRHYGYHRHMHHGNDDGDHHRYDDWYD